MFAIEKLLMMGMSLPVHIENLKTIDIQQANHCFPGGVLQI